MEDTGINAIEKRLGRIREEAENLAREAEDFPAISRNTSRLLSNLRMMEMNLGKLFKQPDSIDSKIR